jgi:hypothetical protein
MLALTVAAAPPHVELRDVPDPVPLGGEVLVRVRAVSLNRGEVLDLPGKARGTVAGWDLAGVTEDGTRVAGLLRSGAWAELAAVPVAMLAEIPDGVSDAQAAALPTAGLTALRSLELGGLLLGRRVLVTGATGGVGRFAVQLARASGADVTPHVRGDTIDGTSADARVSGRRSPRSRADDQQARLGVVGELGRDAAHHHPPGSRRPARTDHDQVGVVLLRNVQDRGRGVAFVDLLLDGKAGAVEAVLVARDHVVRDAAQVDRIRLGREADPLERGATRIGAYEVHGPFGPAHQLDDLLDGGLGTRRAVRPNDDRVHRPEATPVARTACRSRTASRGAWRPRCPGWP